MHAPRRLYVDEDTDDLAEGQDPDEDEETAAPAVEGDTVPRELYEKAVKAERSLRTRLRRTEMAKEFGDDIVELVPDMLPLNEQKALAAKLKEKFATPPAPTQGAEGSAEGKPDAEEHLSEAEKRMAAIVASTGTKAPAGGQISWDEYRNMLADPTTHQKAMQLRKQGMVDESTYPSP
mgnify:CR=1 FL=1